MFTDTNDMETRFWILDTRYWLLGPWLDARYLLPGTGIFIQGSCYLIVVVLSCMKKDLTRR